MSDKESTVLSWLKDAHAMEVGVVDMLEKQVDRTKDYPEMQRKVQEHLNQSKRHAERVEQCIKDLGGDTSAMKEGAAKMSSKMGAWFNAGAKDEVVKNAIGDFSVEHFEIASYRSLIAAAQKEGHTEVATICKEILQEEEDMAAWLQSHLPKVTQEFLDRKAVGGPAKR